MKCGKCGRENPADSDFCQYCGSDLKIKKNSDDLASENYFTVDPAEKPKANRFIIPFIIAFISAVALGVVCFIQYSRNQQTEQTVNELTEQLAEKEKYIEGLSDVQAKLAEKDKTIESQESKISSLEKKNKKLEDQVSELDSNARCYEIIQEEFDPDENYGYASNGFKVSDGIIILKKGGSSKRITLTSDFDDYVEVTTDVDGFSADAIWNEETWYGSTTTLDIVPSKTVSGVTKITFTNDYNNKSFDVFVLVI